MITLTPDAQQSLDFSTACYLQGLCSVQSYMKAIKRIYNNDIKKQQTLLQEQGFSLYGAFRHVYNLDKGETIL